MEGCGSVTTEQTSERRHGQQTEQGYIESAEQSRTAEQN